MNTMPVNRLQEYFREQEQQQAFCDFHGIKWDAGLDYIGGPAELMEAMNTHARLERLEPRPVEPDASYQRAWALFSSVLLVISGVLFVAALWRE